MNNLRYEDDTTLMAENEEELKSFLMKVKVESEKVGLKPNIQKTKKLPQALLKSAQLDNQLPGDSFGAQPSSYSNSHIHTWPLEKP